jgi:hypothetical protein
MRTTPPAFYPMASQVYYSPNDFSVSYLGSNTLTLTGLPFTPENNQFAELLVSRVSGAVNRYQSTSYKFSYDSATGILTVTDASFLATDLSYRLLILGSDKSYSAAANAFRFYEIDGIPNQVYEDSLADTTNVGAAAVNYPSDDGLLMYGCRDFSLTGKLIDADATLTIKVFATNDEDPTPASRDFVQLYGYRSDTNTIVNSISCPSTTVTFAWDFDNLNYKYVRVNFDPGGGATNTVILKARRKAL